jgi:hypothetical protein
MALCEIVRHFYIIFTNTFSDIMKRTSISTVLAQYSLCWEESGR